MRLWWNSGARRGLGAMTAAHRSGNRRNIELTPMAPRPVPIEYS